jgi:hypothetical protein
MDSCPDGLIDHQGVLMLKTGAGVFYIKDGTAGMPIEPSDLVAPVTYEFK